MGLYSDGGIYGISFILDDEILFEETYTAHITLPQLQKVRECYTRYTDPQKERLIIHFYTPRSSKSPQFMSWMLGSKAALETLLEAGARQHEPKSPHSTA